MIALRVGVPRVAVLALLLGLGCAGSDDAEPTGRIVVFGSPDVLLIPAAGGKLERLTIGDQEFWDAAFSPDGTRVAFNPAPTSSQDGITLMYLRDGEATVVPNQPSEDNFASWDIAWSLDGKKLAFVNGDRVFTIATDGSDLRQLGRGVFPVWTPDGAHIVFAAGSYRGPDLDIAVIGSDGKGLRSLGRGLYPDVSPSGDEVAYSTAIGVFVVPIAGGDPRLVVPNGFGPLWSPDGKLLAFTRYTECGEAACSGRVFVVPAEGGKPRAVGPTMGDPGAPAQWIR